MPSEGGILKNHRPLIFLGGGSPELIVIPEGYSVSPKCTQDWYERVFSERLEKSGKVVVVMSRLHEEDIAVEVNTEGWDFPILHMPIGEKAT